MPAFFGVFVDAAYHVVSSFAGDLTPVFGGLAAAAAIVLFTLAVRLLLSPLSYRAMRGLDAQARIAPQVQALRKKHARQPERLQRELSALYQAERTSMFAGCLPLLLQWPFLSVMYLLFRSRIVGGAPNSLLTHDLFGAPLGGHLLGGPGPLSAQGAVFAGLFVLLAGIGWLSARMARQMPASNSAAGLVPALTDRPTSRPADQRGHRAGGEPPQRVPGHPRAQAPGQPRKQRSGQRFPGVTSNPPAGQAGVAGAVARLTPFVTVAIAAFVPLAAGLYLVTTTAWTLAERTLLRRLANRRARARESGAAS